MDGRLWRHEKMTYDDQWASAGFAATRRDASSVVIGAPSRRQRSRLGRCNLHASAVSSSAAAPARLRSTRGCGERTSRAACARSPGLDALVSELEIGCSPSRATSAPATRGRCCVDLGTEVLGSRRRAPLEGGRTCRHCARTAFRNPVMRWLSAKVELTSRRAREPTLRDAAGSAADAGRKKDPGSARAGRPACRSSCSTWRRRWSHGRSRIRASPKTSWCR